MVEPTTACLAGVAKGQALSPGASLPAQAWQFLLPPCVYHRRCGKHRASEPETPGASALLEQYEARSGQHPLLPSGQAAAGLPFRQVADYLHDLDQIP